MKIFHHQHWHLLILLLLLAILYFYTNTYPDIFRGGLWEINTYNWFIFSVLSPIIHQIYVLICWRYELHNHSLSKIFGNNSFKIYKVGFTILILSRLITIILLAISSRMTFHINPVFSYILSGIILIPTFYLFYSVYRYFGMDRAFGLDHFKPEEMKKMPFVNQGIFKYTSNGMYVYGFLILWIPGILLQSKAALIAALFNHIYIWVHYYFTELPDIRIIYEKDNTF